MISPHTPPGTRVVVVWLVQTQADVRKVFIPRYHGFVDIDGVNEMEIGRVFRLKSIVPTPCMRTGFGADLDDGEEGFCPLECLALAELPKSITQCLETQPVLEDA